MCFGRCSSAPAGSARYVASTFPPIWNNFVVAGPRRWLRMRTFLVLICSLALAYAAGSAPEEKRISEASTEEKADPSVAAHSYGGRRTTGGSETQAGPYAEATQSKGPGSTEKENENPQNQPINSRLKWQ